MNRTLHERLVKETEAIRAEVAALSTGDVVRTCALYLLRTHSSETDARLTSPHRQVMFLLGLLLATPEPPQPRQFGGWRDLREWLNSVFDAYLDMYYVDWEARSEDWKAAKEVAAPVFLHYFNQGRLVSPAQHASLFEQLLVPFDANLKQAVGISASDALRAITAIGARLKRQSARVQSLKDEEMTMRVALLDDAKREGWGIEQIRVEARRRNHHDKMRALFASVDEMLSICLVDLRADVGADLAEAFWNQFTLRRGTMPALTYLTDENEAVYRPIYLISPGVGICLNLNELYSAPFVSLERILERGPGRHAFFDQRAGVLERRLADAATAFFGSPGTTIIRSAYEQPGTDEHDLIVLWNRRLFVLEAKSRPPREPLRDPERAFPRIRDDFRSDTGIQRAFEQANHIRTRWLAAETIHLHDNEGAVIAAIAPGDVDEVYMVCVTGDDFGPLAVDLSLLLQKDSGTPFPWAVNIHDLETLLRGWRHRTWGPPEFCRYLDQRAQVHGKIRADDELDLAGYFLRHGSFQHVIDAKADHIVLDLDYSSIFDAIDEAERGGPPVDFTITDPEVADLREMLNGANIKYKMCCGRPGKAEEASEAGLA